MLLKHLRFSLAALAIGFTVSADAQANLGEACGCPAVASRPTVNLSLRADANGLLSATNTVLSCDTVYILNDKIYVTDGKSITIAPGTAIKAPFVTPGTDQNALIVARGGKIFAPGTRECPIVFTSTDDDLAGGYGINNRGRWGGVVLLGRAKNNMKASTGGISTATDGVCFIEGFPGGTPENLHGMPPGSTDDNDNSGIMTFVSIRHGGAVVAANNELNGLTLGSVGRGTTLQHIEVVANADDGIEFFGGTVNLKYASVLFNDDDGIDYDLGYNGRCQFMCVVKTDSITALNGDNGFEADGMDNNVGTYGSSPKFFNATMVGWKGINGYPLSADQNQGIEFKEAVRGEIRNCIFSNYNRGVQFANLATWTLDADGSGPGAPVPYDDAYAAWNAGNLILTNNTFIGTTQAVRVAGANGSGADYTKFAADGNTSVASVAGFSGIHNMNTSNNMVTVKHDLIPGADITSTTLPPVDGFFTPANYRGAFKSGEVSWLYDYSLRALIGLEGALISCPTDINTDGSTTTADYLLLLGEFNTTCE